MRNDINNESEFIPEGLEFKEEYMNSAFDLYDQAMQKKRRRRFFIILFVFGAMGLTLLPFMKDNRPQSDESAYKSAVNLDSSSSNRDSSEKAAGGKNKRDKTQTNELLKFSEINKTAPKSVNGKSVIQKNGQRAQSGKNSDNLTEIDIESENGAVSIKPDRIKSKKEDSIGLENKNPISTVESNSFLAPRTNFDQLDCFRNKADSNRIHIDYSFQPLDIAKRDDPKNSIYVGLGFNTLFSLQDNKKPYLLKESMTLGYQHKFNNRFSLNLNTEYYLTSRVDLSDPVSVGNDYAISSSIPLSYFVLSTGGNWQLNSRNELCFTLGLDHATTNFYSYFRKENEKSIYLDAAEKLRKNNYFVSLGYRYSLSSTTSIYANYKYGFNDAIINFADKNSFDRNSRFQVVMEFKLKQW